MELETRERLKALKYEYIHALDLSDTDRFVSLFTEDAVFEASSYGTVKGHDGIREFINYRANDNRAYHHMATNPWLTVDDDTATGRWYYIVIKVDDNGAAEWGQGSYEDKYRRIEGEWKIASLIAERNYTVELPASFE